MFLGSGRIVERARRSCRRGLGFLAALLRLWGVWEAWLLLYFGELNEQRGTWRGEDVLFVDVVLLTEYRIVTRTVIQGGAVRGGVR